LGKSRDSADRYDFYKVLATARRSMRARLPRARMIGNERSG
jgi:hypothetical protein